ncbi:hypothetical protein QTI66_34730 [Variovorax sp. J22R133]|uniref:hypothetical protein n=1 Tax=Variovorax brevis TaxID=3053503 RepID=UPI0025773DE0|nr:hypothetical protein [Variovorax sp. J22R133]MDM0117277.1 hypothetical protein [Variovorax sp. J22R133]
MAALSLSAFHCVQAIAQDGAGAEDLERAFAASFALVPELARHHVAAACSKHGQQAAQLVRARDTGMQRATALALLTPPQGSSPDAEDQRIHAALVSANTAIVAFVFGPAQPTPELAAAIVKGACLLMAGKAMGRTAT